MVSIIIFLGWPRTAVFPISASQAARITGMSHLSLATFSFNSSLLTLVFYFLSLPLAFFYFFTLTHWEK
jgi:hypothetical protein